MLNYSCELNATKNVVTNTIIVFNKFVRLIVDRIAIRSSEERVYPVQLVLNLGEKKVGDAVKQKIHFVLMLLY